MRPPLPWPARLGFDRIAFVGIHVVADGGGEPHYEVNGTRHRRPCRLDVPAALGRRLIADGIPGLERRSA